LDTSKALSSPRVNPAAQRLVGCYLIRLSPEAIAIAEWTTESCENKRCSDLNPRVCYLIHHVQCPTNYYYYYYYLPSHRHCVRDTSCENRFWLRHYVSTTTILFGITSQQTDMCFNLCQILDDLTHT